MSDSQLEQMLHYQNETGRLHAALQDACDVAIWMSGSSSFGPEGEAHEAWENKMRPKLFAAMEELSKDTAW